MWWQARLSLPAAHLAKRVHGHLDIAQIYACLRFSNSREGAHELSTASGSCAAAVAAAAATAPPCRA